jgi:hypothetical protein
MAGKTLRVKFKPGVDPQKRFEGVVRIITDLIEDGMRDRRVREKALQIVDAAGVKGHDEIGELRAIKNWVQRNAVYRKDIFGVEVFQEAWKQIEDIRLGKHGGDCDDFVILGGSLLGALGYPVGALIVDSNNDGTFNHVMLVTKTFGPTKEFGRNWIPIELIYPQFQLGESVPISRVYPLMANAKTIRAPIMKKSLRGLAGLAGFGSAPMTREQIAARHPPGTNPAHIEQMERIQQRDFYRVKSQDQMFQESHDLANRGGFLPEIIQKHPYVQMMNAMFKRGE